MADQPQQIGGGRRAIGDIAPKLAEITDDVLFQEVWNRTELAARDRSLITVAALVAGGDADQLRFHLTRARENGELWPSASGNRHVWPSTARIPARE